MTMRHTDPRNANAARSRRLRRSGLAPDGAVGRRGRRLLVLGQLAARPARRRCRCPRGRGHAARVASPTPTGSPTTKPRNGYTAGAGTVSHAAPGPGDPRRLDVTISAPVGTFFMRVIGIPPSRSAGPPRPSSSCRCPMGSPQNYYGVGFYESRPASSASTTRAGDPWRRRAPGAPSSPRRSPRERRSYAPASSERRGRERQGRAQPRLRRRTATTTGSRSAGPARSALRPDLLRHR